MIFRKILATCALTSIFYSSSCFATENSSFANTLKDLLGSSLNILSEDVIENQEVVVVQLKRPETTFETYKGSIRILSCMRNREQTGAVKVVIFDASGKSSVDVVSNSATCGGDIKQARAENIERCSEYKGRVVTPAKFDDIFQRYENVPTDKGEFETSAQFETRVNSALGADELPILVSVPFDKNFAKYDADLEQLRIESFAIDNGSVRWSGTFGYGTPHYGKVKFSQSAFGNIDIVVSSSRQSAGSYRATNAFGVNINVQKEIRLTKGIFEGEGRWGKDIFDRPNGTAQPAPFIASIPVRLTQAQAFKESLQSAMVIAPKWPYTARGKVDWGSPTLEAPLDIDEKIVAVVADIQCALILDGESRVITALAVH